MLQDKYGHAIEIGHKLADRDGMVYKVVSISEDGQEMKMHESRKDDKVQQYDCTSRAARNMWIVSEERAAQIVSEQDF